MKRTTALNSDSGLYLDREIVTDEFGNVTVIQEGTLLEAEDRNNIQEEICNAIESFGVTLDGNDQEQLANALQAEFFGLRDLELLKYKHGGSIANNGTDATNDIDFAAGSVTGAMTKQLDVEWAAGTNQGGRFAGAGAIADGTWHCIVIQNNSTGVCDRGFDTSAFGDNAPSGWTAIYRVGSIVRVSSAIKAFSQTGSKFEWLDLVADITASNPGTSAVTRTLTVPTGIVVEALIRVMLLYTGTGGTNCLISALISTDTAPSTDNSDIVDRANGSGQSMRGAATLRVTTNTSAQIRSRLSYSDANVTLFITTYGWIDSGSKI